MFLCESKVTEKWEEDTAEVHLLEVTEGDTEALAQGVVTEAMGETSQLVCSSAIFAMIAGVIALSCSISIFSDLLSEFARF